MMVLLTCIGIVLLAAVVLYLALFQPGSDDWRLPQREDYDVTPRWDSSRRK